MSFTSLHFFLFFPIVAIVYWLLPGRWRWLWLLAASYFFYINLKPVFALLLAFVTCSTHVFTQLISKTAAESKKKRYMRCNVLLLLLPLFFFKYFSAVNGAVFHLLESAGLRWPLPDMKLLLPVGISFYTFVAIGYTMDVYNEEVEAEKNIGITALFISFFPLILSGPIERAGNLLPQFRKAPGIDPSAVKKGLQLMLWGYFMKLVVADRLGMYVDAVYNNIPEHNGTTLLFTAILYPFQVYADLGGYSLIAIGMAAILCIKVMQNFRRPFFATSMSEFWRRWHISLITWLTDYVYTPLSFYFRRYKQWGIVISLLLTFLISGLWHGASLTFVAWGLLQGIFLSVEALTNKQKTGFEKRYGLAAKGWYIFTGCVLTFILFAASQVFGRATSIDDAFLICKKIFTTRGGLYTDMTTLVHALLGLLLLLAKDFSEEFFPGRFLLFDNKYRLVRYSTYLLVFFLVMTMGVLDTSQFIYFQF